MASESEEERSTFLIRYADSKRQGRVLWIGIVGSLGCVALLLGVHFVFFSASTEVGWLFPSLVVLLPAAFVVYVSAVHGSVLGELKLQEAGLEFTPSGSTSTPHQQIAHRWDQFSGWTLDEGQERSCVFLHLGKDRRAITLQVARFGADESRRFMERWRAVAGAVQTAPASRPPGSSRFKRAAGWTLLLLFLAMSLFLILSGEMDRGSWIRLALLCPAVLPAAIRLIQSGKVG